MKKITYGSVCSGIEAATVAWHPLGWKPSWFAEIEAFPSAVLAHHYPDVPNLGDMTTIAARIAAGEVTAPDVLVGGTPCQAFSVAGMRGGLSDARGQLTISFVELANEIDRSRAAAGYEPGIIVWENVPGVLSSKDNAFGCFLAALAGESEELQPPGGRWKNAGFVHGPQRTIAWRVLDAQFFGVAQRRRRVFVVASARNGFDPAAVLFEFDGLRRDSAPSRKTRTSVAALTANGAGTCGADDNQAQAGHIICMAHGQGGAEIQEGGGAPTLTCNHEAPIAAYAVRTANTNANGHGISPELSHTLDGANWQAVAVSLRGRDGGATAELGGDISSCLRASSGGGDKPHVLAFHSNAQASQLPGVDRDTSITDSLTCSQNAAAAIGMAVRRLTPVECERLQAFPDDYTLVPVRGKPAADGPRYKALGNSMCVNVMHWIGTRLDRAMRATQPANDNEPADAKVAV